jgi:hypothetical protein
MRPAARRDDLEQLDATSRWALAALSLGGAFVHFAVMGEHFDVSVPHGVFFAVAAWLQLAFAFAVVIRPSRGVLQAGVIMNMAIIGVWVVSRSFGTPFDPTPWTPEAATFPDVLATVFEGVSVLGCASLLSTRTTRRLSPALGLPAVGALAVAVVILSTLSLVPAVAGESHDHGTALAADGHSHEVVTAEGKKANGKTSAAGVGHSHVAGIESANGTSPCEESGPPVSEGQAAGGHGERGPSSQVAIDDAPTRELLGQQLAVARFVALSFPTAADAQKAGYIRITPYVPCIGAHWIKTSIMDGTFDVNQPEMLLYDASGLDGRMVGLSYWARTAPDSPPEGFAGPNDHWHQHIGLCIGRGGVIGNEATTQAKCEQMGGQKTDGKDSWMVHVWVVPGWESAWGLFSGEHPELGVIVPR